MSQRGRTLNTRSARLFGNRKASPPPIARKTKLGQIGAIVSLNLRTLSFFDLTTPNINRKWVKLRSVKSDANNIRHPAEQYSSILTLDVRVQYLGMNLLNEASLVSASGSDSAGNFTTRSVQQRGLASIVCHLLLT
jgi:hypothetical protein